MVEHEYIDTFIKEADLYHKQGLLTESRQRYLDILKVISDDEPILGQENLIHSIRQKVRHVETDLAETDEATEAPALSEEMQNLISKLFSFSKNKDLAIMEGAVALAKFNQRETAIKRFNQLLKDGIRPIEVAKKIVRFQLAYSSPEAAMELFRTWVIEGAFSKQDLNHLRKFIVDIFEKRGIKKRLIQLFDSFHVTDTFEDQNTENDFCVCSVRIRMDERVGKSYVWEFEVTFQSSDILGFIISPVYKNRVRSFKTGMRLKKMQFFCNKAVYRGEGIVSGVTEMEHGPHMGHYLVDMTILNDA